MINKFFIALILIISIYFILSYLTKNFYIKKLKENLIINLLHETKQNTSEKTIIPEFIIQIPKIIKLNDTTSPLLLIPGLGGSNIYKFDKKWKKLWINISSLNPDILGFEKWINDMKIIYKNNKFFDSGISTAWRYSNYKKNNFIPTDDFGGIDGIYKLLSIKKKLILSNFYCLISMLLQNKYKPKKNLFAAPYDFRKISGSSYLNIYFQMLQDLIEYSKHKNSQNLIIISHCLGSNIFLLFLNYYLPTKFGKIKAQEWKDKHIKKWIPVNSPFAGHFSSSKKCIRRR